tara:strand:- start:500 stop:853 length:354 start_codon:yes stop_codon:yes gene_type:complete
MSVTIISTRQRVFELFDKVYATLVNFPRREQNGIQLLIKQGFGKCLSRLEEADKIPGNKSHYIKRALAGLNDSATWLEISYRNKYINLGFWEECSIIITKIREEMGELINKLNTRRK